MCVAFGPALISYIASGIKLSMSTKYFISYQGECNSWILTCANQSEGAAENWPVQPVIPLHQPHQPGV